MNYSFLQICSASYILYPGFFQPSFLTLSKWFPTGLPVLSPSHTWFIFHKAARKSTLKHIIGDAPSLFCLTDDPPLEE